MWRRSVLRLSEGLAVSVAQGSVEEQQRELSALCAKAAEERAQAGPNAPLAAARPEVAVFPQLHFVSLPNVSGRYRDELRAAVRSSTELAPWWAEMNHCDGDVPGARVVIFGRPSGGMLARVVAHPNVARVVAVHPSLSRFPAAVAEVEPRCAHKVFFFQCDSLPFACQLLTDDAWTHVLIPHPVPWARKAGSIRRLPTAPNFIFAHQKLKVSGKLVVTSTSAPLHEFAEEELRKSKLSVGWRWPAAIDEAFLRVDGGEFLEGRLLLSQRHELVAEKSLPTPHTVVRANAAFDFRRRYYRELRPEVAPGEESLI